MSKENIDWLEKQIEEKYITYYKYSDFKDLEPIGKGSFGNIIRANWINNQFYALKFFNDDNIILKVVNEVQYNIFPKFHSINF